MMLKIEKFPLEDYLLGAKGEEIVWLEDRAFVVRPATDDDIERIGSGYCVMETQDQKKLKRVK
jgi:hypothetical protein